MMARPTNEVQDAFVGLRISSDLLNRITDGSTNVSATIKEILSGYNPKGLEVGKELQSILDYYHVSIEQFLKIVEDSLHNGSVAYDGKNLYGVGELDTRDFVAACNAVKKNPQTILDAYTATIRR